jgi:ornithine cyclodeaminase/alanine dehydrogenase-like protein (mu-crystallin family)
MIRLIISHAPLSSALRTFLVSRASIIATDGEVAHSDVVITTTADISPAACRQLVGAGARIVVLATNRTDASESRYLLAGADHYLEMSADATPLVNAIIALTSPVPAVPTNTGSAQ